MSKMTEKYKRRKHPKKGLHVCLAELHMWLICLLSTTFKVPLPNKLQNFKL